MQKINKTTVFLPFSSLECERFPLRVIVAGGGGGKWREGQYPFSLQRVNLLLSVAEIRSWIPSRKRAFARIEERSINNISWPSLVIPLLVDIVDK